LRNLPDCWLYGILDLSYIAVSQARAIAEAMIEGGVDLVQLRGKKKSIEELSELAATLHAVTAPASIPLIINDYAAIAAKVPVEGVHVGQDDDPIRLARKKAGRPLWIGKSTHSLAQARAAQQEGADYIGFGPIFATPTKPDYSPIGLQDIKRAHDQVTVPIFCIGGIKLENLEQVLAAGAQRVAIVSGLLKSQNIVEYARAAKQLLVSQAPT
jgi:thiamine-phosphate pyrophosphorylase